MKIILGLLFFSQIVFAERIECTMSHTLPSYYKMIIDGPHQSGGETSYAGYFISMQYGFMQHFSYKLSPSQNGFDGRGLEILVTKKVNNKIKTISVTSYDLQLKDIVLQCAAVR